MARAYVAIVVGLSVVAWMAGALVTTWLLERRTARAALVTCIGVFAKEFVVVAVAAFGTWAICTRRRREARVAIAIAGSAFVLWAALQIVLMRGFRLYIWWLGDERGQSPALRLVSQGLARAPAPVDRARRALHPVRRGLRSRPVRMARGAGGVRWTFVALYAAANLRTGAQIHLVPPARITLTASVCAAAIAVVLYKRRAPSLEPVPLAPVK